jgi:hypothetical protein
MEEAPDRVEFAHEARSRIPVELIGEGLLLTALVLAPWVYGAVEDSVRYALGAVLLLASGLFLWPDLREGRGGRGLVIASSVLALAVAQVTLAESLAPILTMEAAMVAFAMAVVWASVDARAASTSILTGRRLAWALLLVCASESAFAAYQWSADRTALFGQKGALQTMPFGSYVNHNNFAGLVSLGVPLSVAMAIGDLRRSGQLTPQGLGLMGLACGFAISVFASGSRGGVVALVGGLCVLAFLATRSSRANNSERRRSWLVPLSVGLVIVAIAVAAVPKATRSRLASLFEQSASTGYRVDIALASARAFLNQPLLGSGLGAFADAVTPLKTGHGDVRSERAEADLIEFVVEGGVVLIAGLLLFGRWAWRSARLEMERSRGRSGKWLRAGALASCATMLLHSLFDFGFRIPANALAFAVLLGLATASSKDVPKGSRVRSGAAVVLLAALMLACVYRSVGAAGEKAALARTSPESRLDAFQPLVDAHPYLETARRQRGLAWLALAYSRGQYDASRLQRAEADLSAVVKTRPQWGEARSDLGFVKYCQGKIDEAKQEMAQAARLDPTHMGVGIAYAQILAWSGNIQDAVLEIARLRRMNPGWSRESARDLINSWGQGSTFSSNVP